MPTVPDSRLGVVIDIGGGLICIDNDLDVFFDALSVTWTVKLAVPAVDDVPLMVPPAERVIPAGSAPEVMDHVYGVVPPEAERFCE